MFKAGDVVRFTRGGRWIATPEPWKENTLQKHIGYNVTIDPGTVAQVIYDRSRRSGRMMQVFVWVGRHYITWSEVPERLFRKVNPDAPQV